MPLSRLLAADSLLTDVFNAACFGAPQSRRRLILTVARRGLVLPGAPQPTHAYTPALTGLARGKWDSGAREHAPSTTRRLHGHAPHHPVTIWDAIADLPAFGFADPFGVVQHANFEKRGLQAWERGVPIGFGDEGKPREYAAPPQSAYQRRSRIRFGASKVEFAKVVTDHVVPAVAELTASRLAHLKAVDGKGKDHGKGNYKGELLVFAERFGSRLTLPLPSQTSRRSSPTPTRLVSDVASIAAREPQR